jgi:thymidylate synthase (FAD)
MDERFTVEVISQTPNPQQITYAAMHQDYAEAFVWADRDQWPDEQKCGELVVKNLLQGNRGHYGPLEHPQIVLNFGFFPHSTMQQMRTHRNVSFDVQSFRYTGQRILEVVSGKQDLEDVFYLRPVGTYSDRQGKKYAYTVEQRQQDWEWCQQACHRYAQRIQEGLAEEHARGLIPFDVRQHWVMSANARSLMHLLDIRGKYDVQLETREMTELMFTQFQQWMPEVASWYEKTRWRKGPLAP